MASFVYSFVFIGGLGLLGCLSLVAWLMVANSFLNKASAVETPRMTAKEQYETSRRKRGLKNMPKTLPVARLAPVSPDRVAEAESMQNYDLVKVLNNEREEEIEIEQIENPLCLTPQKGYTAEKPPRAPLSSVNHNVCPGSPCLSDVKTLHPVSMPLMASPIPGRLFGLDRASPSNSPCKVFTNELSTEELQAVLKKQENRLTGNKRRNTPAKQAAMNRERRYLDQYRQSAAVTSASLDILTATNELHARLSLGPERTIASPSPRGSISLVESWRRWGKSARQCGWSMWCANHAHSRDMRAIWSSLRLICQEDIKEEKITSLIGGFNTLAEESIKAADSTSPANAAKTAAAEISLMKRQGKASRQANEIEMHMRSEAGKASLMEASEHWAAARILHGTVMWMKAAQSSLVSECLDYSAKTHWCQRHMEAAYKCWRKSVGLKEGTSKDRKNSYEEPSGKGLDRARRLSSRRMSLEGLNPFKAGPPTSNGMSHSADMQLRRRSWHIGGALSMSEEDGTDYWSRPLDEVQEPVGTYESPVKPEFQVLPWVAASPGMVHLVGPNVSEGSPAATVA